MKIHFYRQKLCAIFFTIQVSAPAYSVDLLHSPLYLAKATTLTVNVTMSQCPLLLLCIFVASHSTTMHKSNALHFTLHFTLEVGNNHAVVVITFQP